MQFPFIIAGLFMLLSSSYLDNIRGVLLPVLSHSLSLPYNEVSWFMVVGSLTAVFTNLVLMPVVERVPLKKLVLVIVFSAAAIGQVSLLVQGSASLILFGILAGLAISACGALCNLLVFEGTSPTYRSRFLCALHLMYGLGSFLAPVLAGMLLAQGASWRLLFQLVALPFLLLAAFIVVKLPGRPAESRHSESGGALESGAWWVVAAFAAYVPGEVVLSAWLSTYLVEQHSMALPQAAGYVTWFFVVMAICRATCFLALRPGWEKSVLVGCLVVSVIFFFLGKLFGPWAFIGTAALGPFFPLMLGRASRHFHRSSRRLTLAMLSASNAGLAVSHFLVGELTERVGIAVSFWLGPSLLVLSLLLLVPYFRLEMKPQ